MSRRAKGNEPDPEVIMEEVMNGRTRPRMGNRDEIMLRMPVIFVKVKTKWVAIAVGNDVEWQAMCKVMGNPDWCKDENSPTSTTAGKIRMS